VSPLPGIPRLRLPARARPGEVVEIRMLIDHPMETGLRHDGGAAPPRDLIERLEVRRDGALLFAADLRNGTAANPYHVIFVRMERSAEISVAWTDARGRSARAAGRITVS
jgi:sulfur-oxidizing protein SoxZ